MAAASIFYQSNDATLAMNRLYCACAAVPTETDLTEITEALYDVWVAQVMPAATNSWNLLGISARALNEAEGIEHIDTNSYPVNGGVSEAVQNPNQVAYTVTLNTGLVGRSARGRVYGIGLPVNAQTGARLTDTGRATLQSVWELVHSAMETAGHAIQVVSFVEGGVPRDEGRALPVVSVNVRFPLATQRRRLS